MIDYIKGQLAELTPAKAVIEAAGVGYELNISLSSYDELRVKSQESRVESQESKLYVYEDIREDAWVLFGFASKEERELFLLLITVSGVGGNTARTILSAYPAPELAAIIANGHDGMLKRVKGIGGKTAQRIIVELQDKVGAVSVERSAVSANGQSSMVNGQLSVEGEEAIAALQMLGFSPAPTKKVVKELLAKEPDLKAEQIIKQALKAL
ncbi:MAG: Holliday junction branch migration protein RuvA [Bacteroidaceae bacterium]|nr:Holliday junction branch migration protein RuvA [Bacteroidaceae bacterium]